MIAFTEEEEEEEEEEIIESTSIQKEMNRSKINEKSKGT